MFQIRGIKKEDKDFWYTLDRHLPEAEFIKKVADQRGYVIFDDEKPIGILRFNMFWDNIPFLTMIYIDFSYHKKGYGRKAMEFWEAEMAGLGYKMVMTSTQADEEAQHFYRKLGYKDSGCLVLDIPGFEQPLEMFMIKAI
ncbi:GNAT family N-acetyltransferase [Anaerocolumna chitinilytica]|uniref:N-acetyltransferase n=1 Tax=Anaerocolumna chitinilytica TaxID=1727145 RepID=A0A7I8DTZ4_9FIRM|nr:GNAT family N-acetyltransferase [Anaerocolumna chitinilytica]BCK00702.1 N-acetyltransferase [Anaerocolumna chitinilytica]